MPTGCPSETPIASFPRALPLARPILDKMTVTDEEKQPLVAKEATSEPAPTKVAVPVEGTPAVAEERDWDGHLLQVCGECDPLGVSTFAYVKYCFPVAWGYGSGLPRTRS